MLREFMLPLASLLCCAFASIACLDRLCLFHQTYQTMAAKLESERWLLQQCSDPHFFSRMHQHSDLCFQVLAFMLFQLSPAFFLKFQSQVENNARVGAFMLALRQLTQSFLPAEALAGLSSSRLLSWPGLACFGGLLLVGPSWLVRASRARRWPSCVDGHFKDA